MRRSEPLVLRPGPHPDPAVQRAGFQLDDPYLERCWAALIGPAATELLRRVPGLWHQGVASVDTAELASTLGLRPASLTRNPINRTLDRVVSYGFGEWGVTVNFGVPGPCRNELIVYTQVAPLSTSDLSRVPPATRAMHSELLRAHSDRLVSSLTPPPMDARRVRPTSVVEKLERLQRRSTDITRRQGLTR